VTGRFPQISGLKLQFHCKGTTPAVAGMWQPGDDLLQVAIDWISARSPVDPVVEGRIVGP
jgi:hypothetical protein